MKTELRWLVNDGEKVLQYRQYVSVTDYSAIDPTTHSFAKHKQWTEWITVPEFKMNGDNNDNAR